MALQAIKCFRYPGELSHFSYLVMKIRTIAIDPSTSVLVSIHFIPHRLVTDLGNVNKNENHVYAFKRGAS